jgi:hypothetical protein
MAAAVAALLAAASGPSARAACCCIARYKEPFDVHDNPRITLQCVIIDPPPHTHTKARQTATPVDACRLALPALASGCQAIPVNILCREASGSGLSRRRSAKHHPFGGPTRCRSLPRGSAHAEQHSQKCSCCGPTGAGLPLLAPCELATPLRGDRPGVARRLPLLQLHAHHHLMINYHLTTPQAPFLQHRAPRSTAPFVDWAGRNQSPTGCKKARPLQATLFVTVRRVRGPPSAVLTL